MKRGDTFDFLKLTGQIFSCREIFGLLRRDCLICSGKLKRKQTTRGGGDTSLPGSGIAALSKLHTSGFFPQTVDK